MRSLLVLACLAIGFAAAPGPLVVARDRQDRAALQKIVAEASEVARKTPADAAAQYRFALASSYLAEVALELRDKKLAEQTAELGIRAAERAVELKPNVAEHYRVLGTLYGQVIPANVLAGFSYGKRARDAINRAIEIDPKSAPSYISRGVGNYYLPSALGGGPELAERDFRKALELDPKSADAYLWLGLTLRKMKRNADAREAFRRSLELDPNRLWTKEQMDKTPPQ